MTFVLPFRLVWLVVGFVFGAYVTKWWGEACAIHNRTQPPRYIPWRMKDCDECAKEGYRHGYAAGRHNSASESIQR